MWLKIKRHRKHELARINTNSNLALNEFGKRLPRRRRWFPRDPELFCGTPRNPHRQTRMTFAVACAVLSAFRDVRLRAYHCEGKRSLLPPRATRAAAPHFRKKFSHFCAGGVSKKILLKAPPVGE